MILDLNKNYFMMSFRFDKSSPEDFGLEETASNSHLFMYNTDNSLWIQKKLYDFGWGNEYGFMRLPELNFEQLWDLLVNSQIQENQYGAAYIIEEQHSDELKDTLLNLFLTPIYNYDNSMKNAFKLLNLAVPKNRSFVLNKSTKEIEADYRDWEIISLIISGILSEDTKNLKPGE